MKIRFFGAVTLAFCLFFATGASAGVVAYDAALNNGVYFGTGSPNTGFTVFTSDDKTLELGLSAIIRYIGPAPEDLNNYSVPLGPTTVSGRTGSAWGITFSVDTRAGGIGSASLTDYTYLILLGDSSTATFVSFDPFTIPDNSIQSVLGAPVRFQNSEPPTLSSRFNMNAGNRYVVALLATNKLTNVVSTDLIFVNVAPEPATLGLIGSALLGLGLMSSRRIRRNK